MAKRDKYDDDSIFSTPENNPALFRSLLGLTENFYKTRNKYAEKYGVEEVRNQLKRTQKGTDERLKLEQKLLKLVTKVEKDAANTTAIMWENSYARATASRKAEMLKQKIDAINNHEDILREELRTAKILYGKQSEEAKAIQKQLRDMAKDRTRYEFAQSQSVRKNEKRINDLRKQDIANQQKEIDNIRKRGLLKTALFSKKLSKEEREARDRNVKEQLSEQERRVKEAEEKLSEIRKKYDEEAEAHGKKSAQKRYGSELLTAKYNLSGQQGNLDALKKLANTINVVNRNVEMVQKNIQSAYNAFTGKAVQSMNKAEQVMVNYQSKYDIHNDCIAGAEALVRWIHPEFGFMSPADFIPLFEHNGFISQLDFYVWEEVCRDLKAWKAEGRTIVPVSVNVSRIDFSDPLLVEKIVELTDRYGIDRELLHLEVTESVYMDELWQIIQMLKDLREKGFKIEMDDFGSGHSSLNVLSELPVDVLKLDMKFLQEGSSSKKSILGFVISLSKWLNLKTVAEGVETKQQLVALKRFGCDYVQGYYYAKPMNRQEFEIYMEEHARAEEDKRDYLTAEFQEPAAIGKRKETILIAEDSEMNREILKSMLEPYYHIVEATNGKEAYAYLKKHADEISVILLDMIMPVMDGFQFLKKRSKHKEMDEIPVIITSELEEDSDLMALKLGADRFIGKPYQQSLLLLSIQNMIKWKKVSKSDKKK